MSGEFIGSYATVKTDIPGHETPGEVVVSSEAGVRLFIAYADRAIPRGSQVVIYGERGFSSVDVDLPGA